MNFAGLIDKIAAEQQITKADARNHLEIVIGALTSTLAKGEEVKLSGFGTFKSKQIAAKKGRNPATGETIDVPAKTVVRYKASSTLLEAVNVA